jgi:glycosyltransferase involved in cell wall biosynthesis
MNVVIAALSSNRAMSGVSRHAANLVKCLLTRSEISGLHILVGSWEHHFLCEAIGRRDARLHIHSIPLREGTLHRNLWYYRSLPAIAEQLRADIVHLAYPSLIRPGAFPCPTVISLHDLYPYDIPSNFGFPKVLFNRLILRQSLNASSAIACVSDSTRQRLGLEMAAMLPKAVTICNSIEGGPVPIQPSFSATWRNQPFLLCVAQHRRNKNVLLALRVFKRLLASRAIMPEARLVVVGIPGPESRRIYHFVRTANLTERVTFESGISDAELVWCYRNCELLLAPSSVEGFGLPVVEAQLAGCRIVCSDIPAFREVASPGCRFVPIKGDTDAEFAKAVMTSLGERRPTPVYLPRFSPTTIAAEYLQLYTQVIVHNPAARRISGLASSEMRSKSQVSDNIPTAARS